MFRLRVRGRRRARPDRGGGQAARGCLAPAAGRARAGARPPRPGGRPARRGVARQDPRLRLAPAPLAAARPAADRGHRPRLGERDPPRRACSRRTRSRPSSTTRRSSASPTRSAPSSSAGSSCVSRAPRTRPSYRVHDRLGEPCWRCGTPLARVDFEEHTIYYCTVCQTEGRVLKDRRLSRLLR